MGQHHRAIHRGIAGGGLRGLDPAHAHVARHRHAADIKAELAHQPRAAVTFFNATAGRVAFVQLVDALPAVDAQQLRQRGQVGHGPGIGRTGHAAQAGDVHQCRRHGVAAIGKGRHHGFGPTAVLAGVERIVLGQQAAAQGEGRTKVPGEIQCAIVEAVAGVLRAQSHFCQGPAVGVGGVDAVIEGRVGGAVAEIVAVAGHVGLVHDQRGLHRVGVLGLGMADQQIDLERITEAMLATERDLLELGAPLIAPLFRTHARAVEHAVQQRTGGRIDIAVTQHHVLLLRRVGKRDRLDIFLAAHGIDLRIQRVQRELGVVGRLPLQRGGHAQALLVVLQQRVTREIRVPHAIGQAGGERRAGAEAAVAAGAVPAAGVAAFLAHAAFGIGHRQQATEAPVGPGIGDQRGRTRAGLLGKIIEAALPARREGEAVVVERARGAQVHGGAQRALFHVGRSGLAHDQLREQIRGEHVEVEATAAVGAAGLVGAADGGQRFQAVDAHAGEIRAEAAHGDVAAFASVAGDGHAGDALQRFGKVEIGEVGDVLGHHRVDHALFRALDVQRLLHAGAVAGHRHRIQFGGVGRGGLLGGSRGGQSQQHGTGQRAGGQGNRCLFTIQPVRHENPLQSLLLAVEGVDQEMTPGDTKSSSVMELTHHAVQQDSGRRPQATDHKGNSRPARQAARRRVRPCVRPAAPGAAAAVRGWPTSTAASLRSRRPRPARSPCPGAATATRCSTAPTAPGRSRRRSPSR